jgi:hypothetical protein
MAMKSTVVSAVSYIVRIKPDVSKENIASFFRPKVKIARNQTNLVEI